MKKHLINVWYSLPDGRKLNFKGLVTAFVNDEGKAVFDPGNVFLKAFGFELPPHTIISYG